MEFAGEKTEQPTQRRLDEALKKGQFARSPEVQTVFVLLASLLALLFTCGETWGYLVGAFAGSLGHLHQFNVSVNTLQASCVSGAVLLAKCVGPIVLAAALGGLLAGGIQSRFQTASEALSVDWNRINPLPGFKRLFSIRAAVPGLISLIKLAAIIAITYSQVVSILHDPIFYSSVSLERIAQFMGRAAVSITLRVALALIVIAAVDYAYQFWRNQRDLMMTRDEVKEESRHVEGNPQVKARQRRQRQRLSQKRMMVEVPQADVVVTNPTHLAIALKYDRKSMKAPRIVAKGSRLNALRIREIAQQHQVPIVENKPVARMMFKYGRVGGEIPAQLYLAVAEILAWVYRTNRYRYFSEQNQASST